MSNEVNMKLPENRASFSVNRRQAILLKAAVRTKICQLEVASDLPVIARQVDSLRVYLAIA